MATVRKRVYKNGEHRWTADYFDQHKKRHLKTFATRKEAKAWLVATQGEITRGMHTPERRSINVYEAAQLWLEHCRSEGHERGTMRNYEALVRLHICPPTGGVGTTKLALLTPQMFEAWRDRLVQNLTRTRARTVVVAMKAILKEAQRRGLVAQNAAISLTVKARTRDQKKLKVGVDVPGRDDIQKILVAAAAKPFARHRPLLITAAFTGMRASELRGLPWSAVDFEKRLITVRQRADEFRTIGKPKSLAGQREIPMSATVYKTLREWKLACPKGELDLVFPNTQGNVQLLSNITIRVWRPLQRKVGLVDSAGAPLFNFHALRHFAASIWIEAGKFSPKRLQELMGHSSIQMTFNVYGHWMPRDEDEHTIFDAIEVGIVA
jgi:integrase